MSASSNFRTRLILVIGVAMIALTGLSWRLVHIQVVSGDEYARVVKELHTHRVTLHAERGRILDRSGEVLAGNTERFTLIADMIRLVDPEICKRGVAEAEGLSSRDVRRLYSREEIKERYRQHVVSTLAAPLGLQDWEFARLLGKPKAKAIVVAKNLEAHNLARLKELMAGKKIRGFKGHSKPKRS